MASKATRFTEAAVREASFFMLSQRISWGTPPNYSKASQWQASFVALSVAVVKRTNALRE
jgi:hypothetical protein